MAPNPQTSSRMGLCVLGCGTMGTAILSGILASLTEAHSADAKEALPPRLPSKFTATVSRPESVKRVETALKKIKPDVDLEVLQDRYRNVEGISRAEVILLCCKPYMISEVLGSIPDVAKELEGKLLISICAGVSVPQLQKIIFGDNIPENPEQHVRIVHAVPNTASKLRQSMTVISIPNPPLPPAEAELTAWILTSIGCIRYIPAHTMDAGTVLGGSGPAFYALVLEAMADGAVAMGIPRAEAQYIAAQTMKGTAELVLDGEHPSLLREKVSTPGGCTIAGLLVMEEGGVRGAVSRAIREGTVVTSQLGEGVKNVNGTRH